MKCQVLFSGIKYGKYFKMFSAEFSPSKLNINDTIYFHG